MKRVWVILGAAALVAVCACSSKAKQPGAAGTPSPSSSVPGATAGTPSAGVTAGNPSPGASKPATSGGGTVSKPPPGTRLFVARPAGTYSFTTSGQTQLSGAIKRTYQMPSRTTLAIDAATSAGQRSVRDMRDGNGNGRVTDMRVSVAADGLHLTYLKNTSKFAGVTDSREFKPDPPPLILRTGAPNGDHLSFTIEGSGLKVTTTVDVVRREMITIGGRKIQAVVIRLHSTFSGDVNGTDDATNWLRPSDGLLLREDDRSDVQAGFTRVKSNYTATLERLTP